MMSFFVRYLLYSAKRLLRSGAFWSCCILFAAFSTLFAAVYPAPAPLFTEVGVLAAGDDTASAALVLLCENDDFTFVAFDDAEEMRRRVLTGELHCAYLLNGEAEPPIVSWGTDASLMRPVLDDLVQMAWFEAAAPQIAAAYLEKRGVGSPFLVREGFENSDAVLQVRFETAGRAASLSTEGLDIFPLLHAVLVSVFLLCCALTGLLLPADAEKALAPLGAAQPRRRFALLLAPVVAHALLLSPALLLSFCLLPGDGGLSPSALWTLIPLLAAAGSLTAGLMSMLRRRMPWMFLLPVGTILSVAFSGALIDPVSLGAVGWIRYLSPAWWVLWLTAGLQ